MKMAHQYFMMVRRATDSLNVVKFGLVRGVLVRKSLRGAAYRQSRALELGNHPQDQPSGHSHYQRVHWDKHTEEACKHTPELIDSTFCLRLLLPHALTMMGMQLRAISPPGIQSVSALRY
jgi:hypothetical protein